MICIGEIFLFFGIIVECFMIVELCEKFYKDGKVMLVRIFVSFDKRVVLWLMNLLS